VLAVEQHNEEEAFHLLRTSETPQKLLMARTERGLTPLMLAMVGCCSEQLIEEMLAFGPDVVGVALRSDKGHTAADYAAVHMPGSGLVSRLRSLEQEELERTAAERCPICGKRLLKRPKLAALVHKFRHGSENNTLLKRFFNDDGNGPGGGAVLPMLLKPHFHALNNDVHCRKKLSQSLAVLEALERAVGHDGLNGWHVVDICSGKSLTAALAALRHPGAVVTAVDRLPGKKTASLRCSRLVGC